ncbi:hypothetical protein X801_09799 [Opisthorchis viverrini]|uniref:Tumor protein D52 family protein n=1 Tax=Opisthorchis viverrini TaxID=6198 RepID=A0A1S8WIZ6_OPIVI|nr:hypothetical protein X801_09799 [Opisthorchis viverrini]
MESTNAEFSSDVPPEVGVDALNKDERAVLESELMQLEEDIQTLKLTLAAKLQQANELKKRLGYTTFGTLRYDIVETFHKIEDTDAYKQTSEFLGKAKEKTVAVAQEAREKVDSTLSAIKNSDAMKTLTEKVGSTYTTVKDALIHSTYGHAPDD